MTGFLIVEAAVLLEGAAADIKTGRVYLYPQAAMSITALLLKIFLNMELVSGLYGLLLGVIFLVISGISRESVGYGDGLVIASMGSVLGIWTLLYTLFLAFLGMSILSLALLIAGKEDKNTRIQGVPFIAMGFLGVFLYEIV